MKKDNLLSLTSELRNQASMNLPHMSIADSTAMFNKEDEACTGAVAKVLPVVNEVIVKCIETVENGGRIIFTGAAHSGFLGALDAMEANATFGTNVFDSIVAGNPGDIMKTDGSAEDNEENGGLDLQNKGVCEKDFVIALSSSGRTPYAIGALKWCQANNVGCAALTNNSAAIMGEYADFMMAPEPGPEVISGSTRLKAGTCQKMILNMITTVTMAQVGNVYQNLMINVPPVSQKMRKRLVYILTQATGCSTERAQQLMEETEYKIKPALLMELKGLTKEEALVELEKVNGNINHLV